MEHALLGILDPQVLSVREVLARDRNGVASSLRLEPLYGPQHICCDFHQPSKTAESPRVDRVPNRMRGFNCDLIMDILAAIFQLCGAFFRHLREFAGYCASPQPVWSKSPRATSL